MSSELKCAIEAIPDGVIRLIADSKDVASCRARILSALLPVAPEPADAIPSREEQLESALVAAVETIQDYLAYEHDGDPWSEDARAMGEMDINAYGRDGRLEYALSLLPGPSSRKEDR